MMKTETKNKPLTSKITFDISDAKDQEIQKAAIISNCKTKQKLKRPIKNKKPKETATSKAIQEELKDPEFEEAFRKEKIKTRLAKRIKKLREAADLSQTELAKLMGKQQANIARTENPDNGATPTIETLVKFAEALGGSLEIKFCDLKASSKERQKVFNKYTTIRFD